MGKKAKCGDRSIVAVVAIGSSLGMSAAKRGNKAVEVRIEPVQKRDLVASVTASGQVRPQTKVDVASDMSGKIVRLAVKEGQMVTGASSCSRSIRRSRRPTWIAREAAVASSQGAARAGAGEPRAGADAATTARPTIKKANPHARLRRAARAAHDGGRREQGASSRRRSTRSIRRRRRCNDAKSALGKTTIYAPMAGRVTRLDVEQGETAVPGTFNKDAATLLTISDMSVLETKVKVDETDVARIKIGDSAQVQIDAFPDTTFIGRVTKISNSSVKARDAADAPTRRSTTK